MLASGSGQSSAPSESRSAGAQSPASGPVERTLLGMTARFEATEKDDVERIKTLGGEESYFQSIIEALRPDDCFWDIGAFVGSLTVFAAQRCSRGRVVAVEPDPSFVARVKRNLEINGISNVTVLPIGLSDQPGVLRLNTGGVAGWAPSFFEKGLGGYVDVKVQRLDDAVAENPALAPTVLKVDVEGFEGKVFDGGRAVLGSSRLRMLFIELHPKILFQQGERIGKIIADIEQHGFSVRDFIARRNEVHLIALRRGVE